MVQTDKDALLEMGFSEAKVRLNGLLLMAFTMTPKFSLRF